MATINLLPDGDISNDWTLSTGSDVYALLDEDTTGLIGSDGSRITATAALKECIVTFQDFSEDFSSIDSVQAVVRAGNNGRGRTFRIESTIFDNTSSLYVENSATQGASTTYRTITYTNRTTSDGSSAWTNSNINNLRMQVALSVHSGGTTSCTYCYFIITYTEPIATTDNSIFFGTNF